MRPAGDVAGRNYGDAVIAYVVRLMGAIENAMRWQVKARVDDSTCEPCKKNDGKLYRNRSDAYADYPGGKGYIKCVGAEYGNSCRCTVNKRKGKA